jgi:23S rRNA (cytosine1962-C5)-methyltransferase
MTQTLRISRRAADRLRAGHLWVYRSDLETDTSGAPAGGLVTVADARGPVGSGMYSSASQIAVRLVSREGALTREQYLADVRERVAAALRLRAELAPVSASDNAHRLIFAEADGLPGIVADRYNDLVLLQLLTQSTAQDDVREAVVSALRDALAPGGEPLTIWERPDPRIRELEQLAAPKRECAFTNAESAAATTIFHLNGLRFGYDAAAGQKTGAFLDQRLNYAAAARWVQASGRTQRALDVCTYHGGFALHLAAACARVTGVDASRTALEAADQNLLLNPRLTAEVDWIEADAFELLRAFDAQGERYGAMVLDPPAFAKSKRAAEGAARGYKELNLRAMRMMEPGGTLVTCSCSHHVGLEEFTQIVAAAASDAGRRVQLLETRAAAPDHPEVLTLPETRYLKCLICRVD